MKKAKILGQIGSVLEKKFQLKDNTLIRGVKDYAPDRIELEIGDEKTPDEFLPQAKIKRWDNEVNFSIRWKHDHIPDDPDVSFSGKNVRYKKGKQSFQAYELDPSEVGEDGGLEIEIVLDEQPQSNVFEFTLQTKELDFFYQPPLTQEFQDGFNQEFNREIVVTETHVKDADGNVLVHRPENVVGSYSVYHASKRDNFAGGKEYKTGKAFHIYRPKIIDKSGEFVYGTLEIDLDKNELRVIVPQDFLATAQYPVTVDPTFGYGIVGLTGYYLASNSLIGTIQTCPTGGANVVALTSSVGAGAFKPVIANSSLQILPGAVGAGMTPTNNGWSSFVFASPVSLTGGTDYLLSLAANTSFSAINGDSTSGKTSYSDSSNSYSSPSDPTDATLHNNRQFSIFAIYEPPTGFPIIKGLVQERASSVTSKNLALPTSTEVGDLLLISVSSDQNTTLNISSGNWTKLGQAVADSTMVGAVFYKIAEGSDTAPLTVGASSVINYEVFRITNASGVVSGTFSTGYTSSPNPPSHDAGSSKKYLWIALALLEPKLTSNKPSNGPSGYNFIQSFNTGIGLKYEEKQTDDPGTFTSVSSPVVCVTLAIEPTEESSPTTQTLSHTADTLLQKEQSLSNSIDTLLKKQATDAVSIDTITIKKQSVSSTVDTLLINEAVVSHALDTILSKAGSVNHATDTILVKQQENQLSTDTIVKTEKVAQLTADTFISQQSIVQTSTDTVLVKESELFSTVDTTLYALTQNELELSIDTVVIISDILDSTTDTLVADHQDLAAQADTFLIANDVVAGTADTFIFDRHSDQVSIDTLLLAQKNKQATIDTVIAQAGEVESFIDALLILKVLAQSSTDTVLIKSRSRQSSIDTTLIKSELAEASIDTYILPAMSTIGTVYASIVLSDQIQASVRSTGLFSSIEASQISAQISQK